MIPDWKLEKYLTGDLPFEEMQKLHELEATDEIFANRVRILREDNLAILRKLPFERLSQKLESRSGKKDADSLMVSFKFVKLASAAALVLAFIGVFASVAWKSADVVTYEESVAMEKGIDSKQLAMADVETGTRTKGMDARIEVWKKTEKGIVQMENLAEAREGDEIQLRYSVPQKCFGLLFSMDGNGTITLHMGNENKAIALEPGKMVTLPFAYKLDNAPKFEKFFLLTSQKEFELDVSNIDAVLKKDGVDSKTLTLRKVGEENE